MYLFFLGVVPLPITPGALTIKTPSLNKTVNLINEGEINIPKQAGLREISFEFLLPQVQQYPFANYQLGRYTASIMIPLLNVWKNTMLPIQFIVTRMSPSGKILYFTNIKCLIEDFEYKEDAEEYGLDVMCSITLKEYKEYGTKSIKIEEPKPKEGDAATQDEQPKKATVKNKRSTAGKQAKKYTTVQKGDTAANIVKRETGSFPEDIFGEEVSDPEWEAMFESRENAVCQVDPLPTGETVEVLDASKGIYVDVPVKDVTVVEASDSALWARNFKRHWNNQWKFISEAVDKGLRDLDTNLGQIAPPMLRP